MANDRRLDLGYEPLGRLSVVTSSDHDKTKTETERWMPVHPSLASLLAEWRLSGWPAAYGRQPEPGDLVVPVLPEPRRKGRVRWPGSMLSKDWVWKRLRADVRLLGPGSGASTTSAARASASPSRTVPRRSFSSAASTPRPGT